MDDTYAYDIEEELVAVIPSQQNWKGIGISLVVIISVIGLVALSVVIITPPHTGPRIKGARIALHNFTSGIFSPNSHNATWFSECELAFIDSLGNLVSYNPATRTRNQILNANVFRAVNSYMFSLSPDSSWILIRHQERSSAFSSKAMYSLQNIEKGSSSPLLRVGVSGASAWDTQEYLETVKWAGRSGGVVIVKDNDIYYRPDPHNTAKVTRITSTGVPGVVFNGVPDWLYRERILGGEAGMWLAPDLGAMVYSTINSSRVSVLRYPEILSSDTSVQDLSLRFPKVGGRLPEIQLFFFNFQSLKSIRIQPPQVFKSRAHYVESVGWVNSHTVSISWLSRAQDFRVLSLCQLRGASCNQVLLESALNLGLSTLPHGFHPPVFDRRLERMTYISLKQEGADGLFPHIHLRNLGDGVGSSGVRMLTFGTWKVNRVLSWDTDNDTIYYLGSEKGEPESQHLYKHTLSDSQDGASTCLTCSGYCSMSEVRLAPDNRHFIQHCLGPSIPYSQVISTTGEVVLVLDENSRLRDTLSRFSAPQTKYIQVDRGSGRNIKVQLTLPPGFREYEEFAFPLLLYIGTVNPRIDLRWGLHWTDYLSSNKDYIIAKVETGNVKSANHSLLQTQQDILAVLRHLRTELHYVDRGKLGLIGEGEGGFTAARVLGLDHSHLASQQCTLFISPTVDWRLSDAFTGENLAGEHHRTGDWSSLEVTDVSSSFPSKKMYLTNNPGDLINLEQLLVLSRAMVRSGTIFKQQIYLGDRADENSLVHFYKSMEAHLDDCLGPVEDYFRDDYFLASIAGLA